MPIKVEAAIVTQKRPSASFNNDSVNINGKVFDREIIRNGYKGSGIISDNVYFALTSSDVDGFADAAAAAFNDSAADLSDRETRTVFDDYFSLCSEALLKTEHSSAGLSAMCFYACGRKVVVSANSDTKLFSVTHNGFNVFSGGINEADGKSLNYVFPDVAAGDIFILAGPGVCETLSDKDIADICRVSDGAVKRIANLVSKVALSKVNTSAVSVIAVKILETGLDTDSVAGFVPDFSDVIKENAVNESADNSVALKNEEEKEIISASEDDNISENETNSQQTEEEKEVAQAPSTDENSEIVDGFASVIAASLESRFIEMLEEDNISDGEKGDTATSDDNEPEEGSVDENEEKADSEEKNNKALGVRQKLLIAVGAIAVLSVILFVVAIAFRFIGDSDVPASGEEAVSTTLSASDEATTEEKTTAEEKITSEEETTEEEAETTTKVQETTTAAQETTTAAQETTTAAQETTTAAQETTTAAQETTTAPQETTTAPQETTTAVSEANEVPENTEE